MEGASPIAPLRRKPVHGKNVWLNAPDVQFVSELCAKAVIKLCA